MSESRPLTPKQKLFVEEYLVDLNAAAAYLRAGYRGDKDGALAGRLIRKDQIRRAIDVAMAERSQRTQMEADEVLTSLTKIARFDIRSIFDHRGNLKPIHEWPEEAAVAAAGVEVVMRRRGSGTERVQKVRIIEKVRALELLGKHLGILKDHIEVSQPTPLFVLRPEDIPDASGWPAAPTQKQ
jgi:phage terminase small subunit